MFLFSDLNKIVGTCKEEFNIISDDSNDLPFKTSEADKAMKSLNGNIFSLIIYGFLNIFYACKIL